MKVPFSTLSDKEFKIQSVINYALIFAVIWGGVYLILHFLYLLNLCLLQDFCFHFLRDIEKFFNNFISEFNLNRFF